MRLLHERVVERQTDFENCGFSGKSLECKDRHLLLTVDFESFSSELMNLWNEAMIYWALKAKQKQIPFDFFLSIEHAQKIRFLGGKNYEQFKDGLFALDNAMVTFYPHNHCFFDLTTGDINEFVLDTIPMNYTKRRSMFYNVVYKNKEVLSDWLFSIKELYKEIIIEADCKVMKNSVLRAGGWDYGSTREDLSLYIDSLLKSGFTIDSSACRGIFGTNSWKIGRHFGENIFNLNNGLLEVASCFSFDCGTSPFSLSYTRNLINLIGHRNLFSRKNGIFVIVLHFDHLFHSHSAGQYNYFAIRDIDIIKKRIDYLFNFINVLKSTFNLKLITFNDIGEVL